MVLDLTVADVLALEDLKPKGTRDEQYDTILSRTNAEIGHNISSFLQSFGYDSERNFIDEIVEGCSRRVIEYASGTNYFKLGSFHDSFYRTGVMEALHKYSSQTTASILGSDQELKFSHYAVRLHSLLISQIEQQEGLGKELVRPLDRFLGSGAIMQPGTLLLGLGLYLARQGLVKGELSSENAHKDGYVGLESVLSKKK